MKRIRTDKYLNFSICTYKKHIYIGERQIFRNKKFGQRCNKLKGFPLT